MQDLDGFYAQVESKRKGLGADVPLAVQQWDGIIAREAGWEFRWAGNSCLLPLLPPLKPCHGLFALCFDRASYVVERFMRLD